MSSSEEEEIESVVFKYSFDMPKGNVEEYKEQIFDHINRGNDFDYMEMEDMEIINKKGKWFLVLTMRADIEGLKEPITEISGCLYSNCSFSGATGGWCSVHAKLKLNKREYEKRRREIDVPKAEKERKEVLAKFRKEPMPAEFDQDVSDMEPPYEEYNIVFKRIGNPVFDF